MNCDGIVNCVVDSQATFAQAMATDLNFNMFITSY